MEVFAPKYETYSDIVTNKKKWLNRTKKEKGPNNTIFLHSGTPPPP